MNVLADTVKVTLGPKGRNVVLDTKWGAPTITNDGVSIAKEIELDDPYEKLGAELVKEVAKKTDDVAGDGTTTATVLAQALVREGLRNVAAGANPIALKRGIEQAVAAVTEALANQARDVETREQIAATASISAGDPTVGEIIAEAMDKVGKEGVITVEESNTFGLELELTEGMRFDKGYISPYFVTDTERMEAVLDDPYLLIVEKQDLEPERPAADPGEGHAGGQAAGDHRRGRRGRGPGDPGRQQDPRHLHVGGRQGARLRRPAQGHAGRPRRPHRWPGRQRDGRSHPGQRRAGHAGPGPQGRRHQGRDHHRRRRRRRRADRRPGRPAPRRDRRTATPTTTGRSCRSAWPSWPAVSRSSRSARPPRSSSRSASTASRTPSATPRPPSRRACFPVAGWRWPTPRPPRSTSST